MRLWPFQWRQQAHQDIIVHVIEYPSMHEQGAYYICPDQPEQAILVYGVTQPTEYYLDAGHLYDKDMHATVMLHINPRSTI